MNDDGTVRRLHAELEHLGEVLDRLTAESKVLCLKAEDTTRKSDEDKLRFNDQLTSIKKEKDDLKSVNTLLTKRLQEKEKELADLGKQNNDLIEKLKSENENMKLQNAKLKAENENVKLQNETLPSKANILMVLYRCSEKAKCIASMKLLGKEEDVNELKNELHGLQNFIASQNETKNHKNKSNGEKVQISIATDFDDGGQLTLIQDENSTKMKHVNGSKETSAAQSTKKDKRFLEKELTSLINKADKFCAEFEEKIEEERRCLVTKLTSCHEQLRVLRKSFVQLKKEKLVFSNMVMEMDDIMSNYRKQLERV